MTSWLFQGVPPRFNFHAFIISAPRECLWLANQHRAEMRCGDAVFLWRGKGNQPEWGGLVGLGEISGEVEEQADSSSAAAFWENPADSISVVSRVPLKLFELRLRPVDYDDLQADPLLSGVPIFDRRQRRASNFRLTEPEARRLLGWWRH